MKERWIDVSAQVEEKQEEQFQIWLNKNDAPFGSERSRETYKERVTLLKDAIQMKKTPRRIPVCPSAGHFPIQYAGISWYEAMYDYDKLIHAWEKYHADFNPDACSSPMNIPSGKALAALDYTQYKWAGQSLREDQEYQFVEKKYMQADEYYDLIDDPTGFFLNTFFPRVFGALEPLVNFPNLPPVHEILVVPMFAMRFGMPDVQSALSRLMEAGNEVNSWLATCGKGLAVLVGKGFPTFSAGFSKAPFDVIGDSLRGTQGVLTDMFRNPDELLEACERLTPFMIKYGAASCKAAGHIMPFIPLHKGGDGFMSNEQFATFYWPTLRKVIIGLINEGLIPQLFAEGGYNQRLEIISDLPKGKTLWWFDATDMARAKETIGKVACIAGNVPLDILCTGSTDDVETYCQNLIDTAGKDGGFILSSGAGVQGAKPENVKAMIDYSKKHGCYPN
jgi:hypothetical protein